MKQIITIAIICIGLLLPTKSTKINVKTEIKTYTIKIEKVENDNGSTLVYGKIKQQQRFSYSVEFADCAIITSSNPDGVKGELVHWNDDKKIPFTLKSISDKTEESFVLAFPEGSIPQTGTFDLKLGTMHNQDKTELIVSDLTLTKKK